MFAMVHGILVLSAW